MYRTGAANGYEAGVRLVIEAVLMSPYFLYRTELGSDVRLERGKVREQGAERHSTLSIRTAADFSSGCLETGSQIVMVSSFAARGRPSGPASSDTSQ